MCLPFMDSLQNCLLIYKKKTWESNLLLVPRTEALASPNQSERATPKPTPICI